MESRGVDIDLPLTLDDFIPPHLQKKTSPGSAQNHLEELNLPSQTFNAVLRNLPSQTFNDVLRNLPSQTFNAVLRNLPSQTFNAVLRNLHSQTFNDVLQNLPSQTFNDVLRNQRSQTFNDTFNDVLRNQRSQTFNDVLRNQRSQTFNDVLRNQRSQTFNDVLRNLPSQTFNDVLRNLPSQTFNDVLRNLHSQTFNDVLRNLRSQTFNDVLRNLRSQTFNDVLRNLRSQTFNDVLRNLRSQTFYDVLRNQRSQTFNDVLRNLPSQTFNDVLGNLPSQTFNDVQWNLPSQTFNDVQWNLPSQTFNDVLWNLPSQTFNHHWQEKKQHATGSYQPYNITNESHTEEEDSLETSGTRKERYWIRYDGVGPTDEDGMPFASRSSVEQPRDWYKCMFRVLHPRTDSEDSDSETEEVPAHQIKSSPTLNKYGFQKDLKLKHTQNDLSVTTTSAPREHQRTLNHTHSRSQRLQSYTFEEHDQSASNVSSRLNSYSTLPSPCSHSTGGHVNASLSSNGQNFIAVSSRSISQSLSNTVPRGRSLPLNNGTTESWYKQELTPGLARTSSVEHNHQYSHTVTPPTKYELKAIQPATSQSLGTNQRVPSGSIYETLSPTSKEQHVYRRSTSKILDQLESDLRDFTEELERDQQVHKDTPGNLLNMKTIAKAVVKFDFVAQSPKELSLLRGSSVSILKRVDHNWLLGEQDGVRGLFPANYVKVLCPGQPVPKPTSLLSGIALYNFKVDSATELPLRKGQRVLIIRRVGGNWFEGRIEGSERLGLFPASYVRVIGEPTQQQKGTSQSNGQSKNRSLELIPPKEKTSNAKISAPNKIHDLPGTMYRVIFDFSPSHSDELHLIAGDIVHVTQHCDDGWFVGVCWRTQKFGTFPGNFVVPHSTT
ncbi:vinexin [Pelodytes ibericus]